ncbi:hypothetical protein D9M68_391580 [compost metagenome]
MLGGQLQRVDDAQHLVEVAAGGHRIDEDEFDLLVRTDDEDVAHRLVVGWRALGRVAGNRRRQHAVELRDGVVDVGDHREVRRMALRFLDVGGPAGMPVERIDGEADDLDAAPVEFRLDARHVAELGGADGRVVLGVREQDRPGVADPVVKPDGAIGRSDLEVRCEVIDCKRHDTLQCVCAPRPPGAMGALYFLDSAASGKAPNGRCNPLLSSIVYAPTTTVRRKNSFRKSNHYGSPGARREARRQGAMPSVPLLPLKATGKTQPLQPAGSRPASSIVGRRGRPATRRNVVATQASPLHACADAPSAIDLILGNSTLRTSLAGFIRQSRKVRIRRAS